MAIKDDLIRNGMWAGLADGTIQVGEYGVDFTDDGSWLSFRQNLPPVVVKGKTNTHTHSQNVWGTNYGGVLVSNRSAVCNRADGRLMFAYVPLVKHMLLRLTSLLRERFRWLRSLLILVNLSSLYRRHLSLNRIPEFLILFQSNRMFLRRQN